MALKPTIVSGTVTDPSGKPVPSAAVSYVRGPVPLPEIAALTGDDGAFSLTAPVPGRYEVQVNAEGHRPAVRSFEVESPGVPVRLDFRFGS